MQSVAAAPATGVLVHDPEGFWLLLIVISVALILSLGWLVLRTSVTRFTFDRLTCPVRGRPAQVVFARTRDGMKVEVMSCSLIAPSRRIDCGKACLLAPPG